MRRVATRSGLELPVLGLGTWTMGEQERRRDDEVAALKLGLDLGLTLIDTAEMYASGGAEEIVAEAIAGRRDEVLLVSKVLPQNASRSGTVRAAERSLARLRTDRIDLYLLHWAGPHPLEETYAAFEQLVRDGKIRAYGVSNFDIHELDSSETIAAGRAVSADQVLYNLGRRSAERQLLPWCRERGVALMAYSPFEQGRLGVRPELSEIAARHGVTPYQVALAWTIREPGVLAIPMSRRAEHVREIVAAAALRLDAGDLAALDRAYPPPRKGAPLETL
ncbi:MAG TPA: aldo/keto reductase [Candidatus Polarisedimenticolaceae bacterium]|nr:aldo/keto reductase [Candidatus Polarisedimenticolaceae bacterium]